MYIYKNKQKEVVKDEWVCNAGSTKMDIESNGDVLSCPFCKTSELGNIKTDSVQKLWANPNRQKFLKATKIKKGRFCAPIANAIFSNENASKKLKEFFE